MTDLTPNDLSHLSDAKFQSLCPQGEHAPGPEPLSPAAQAVLDAYWQAPLSNKASVAAAIRAVADQVVPEELILRGDQRWMFERDARQASRSKLLAIVTELEGHA